MSLFFSLFFPVFSVFEVWMSLFFSVDVPVFFT